MERDTCFCYCVCARACEHVWIMPAVICMQEWEKVSPCVCVCCSGVPGSPVFTDRKCLSRQKGRNLAAPHGKHWESSPTCTHTRNRVKKRNLTGAPVFVSEVGYLVLGKWEWLGWALTVLHFPPHWLPAQTPADRKSIHWPCLNLWEHGCGLTGLSTPIHKNWLYVCTNNCTALVDISAPARAV